MSRYKIHKVNECVYVTYHALTSMINSMYPGFPEEARKDLEEFTNYFEKKYLPPVTYERYDLIDSKLIEKIKLEEIK